MKGHSPSLDQDRIQPSFQQSPKRSDHNGIKLNTPKSTVRAAIP